jgi:uncharacterized protein (DUF1697 family)
VTRLGHRCQLRGACHVSVLGHRIYTVRKPTGNLDRFGVSTQIVLLRGINIGPRNRVPMARLREALEEAGFAEVRTHLQSGNVVLESQTKPEQTARKCERVIEEEFGLEIDVVVRTPTELGRVVKRNPLGKVARDPKRYQVSFLAGPLPAAGKRKLEEALQEPEELVFSRREIFAWHPNGVARSKLWAALAGRGLGVTATARNWTTVTKLLELASR